MNDPDMPDAPRSQAAAASGSQLQVLMLNRNGLTGPVPQALAGLPLFEGGFTLLDGVSIPATLELSGNELRWVRGAGWDSLGWGTPAFPQGSSPCRPRPPSLFFPCSGPFPGWVVQELVGSSVVVNLEGNRQASCMTAAAAQARPAGAGGLQLGRAARAATRRLPCTAAQHSHPARRPRSLMARPVQPGVPYGRHPGQQGAARVPAGWPGLCHARYVPVRALGRSLRAVPPGRAGVHPPTAVLCPPATLAAEGTRRSARRFVEVAPPAPEPEPEPASGDVTPPPSGGDSAGDSAGGSSGLAGWEIALIVLGSVAGAALLGLALLALLPRLKSKWQVCVGQGRGVARRMLAAGGRSLPGDPSQPACRWREAAEPPPFIPLPLTHNAACAGPPVDAVRAVRGRPRGPLGSPLSWRSLCRQAVGGGAGGAQGQG